MAYSTIPKPSLYFNTKLYDGNSSTNAITGVGHQPDMVWMKQRNATINHYLYDAVRGATNRLQPNLTNAADTTDNTWFNSFDSDGFTVGSEDNINDTGDTYVSWNWKAGTGQGSSNTDGSINTTYTSVNTTAGFSINQYTGTGATATVGHGLGVVPDFMIIKKYSASGTQWTIYHKQLGPTKHILFTTGAEVTQANYWNDTAPTNLVWTMGNQSEINGSGTTNICYAFAEKKGYSKFGSYVGNASTNGTFIYTGFKPAMVILKDSTSVSNWMIYDNKREGYNVDNDHLKINNSDAEGTSDDLDILSNGFKLRTSGNGENKANATFIYMAIAAEPLVANVGASIPATAR